MLGNNQTLPLKFSSRKILGLQVLTILLGLVACSSSGNKVNWTEAQTSQPHKVTQENNLPVELLWVQEVYIARGSKGTKVVAVDDKVFFLGSTESTERGMLVALQGNDGKTIWQKTGSFREISADSEALYVGGQSWIFSFMLASGETIWSTKLPGFHNNVMYLYAVDDVLYTQGSTSGEHLKNVKTGEIFDISQSFRSFPSGILEAYIPTITKDKIFYGSGKDAFSSASAWQRQPYYDLLWKTEEENVISNVAVSDKVAYFLTYNDDLLMLNVNTGERLGKIHFEPSINFFENQGASQGEGYYVAVDGESNLLYVILGDSNQMFAFQILLDAEIE